MSNPEPERAIGEKWRDEYGAEWEYIGHGVSIAPLYGRETDDGPRVQVAIVERHTSLQHGGPCEGVLHFEGAPERYLVSGGERHSTWTVHSLHPLTLSPSVRCRTCGHHGFIREGRWVPA